MSDEFSEPPVPEFSTQMIQPVAFRYPTGWMSWQAVLGDLAARGNPDARLRIEASGAETATHWKAEIEWGENREQVAEQPSRVRPSLDRAALKYLSIDGDRP